MLGFFAPDLITITKAPVNYALDRVLDVAEDSSQIYSGFHPRETISADRMPAIDRPEFVVQEKCSLLQFTNKINSLRNLPENWNSYGAVAPNELACYWTRQIVSICYETGFSPSAVTPSAENGIGVSFVNPGKNLYADIECFNDGTILAVTSNRHDVPDVWSVSTNQQELKRCLSRIREFVE